MRTNPLAFLAALLLGSAPLVLSQAPEEPPRGYRGILIAPPRYELVLAPGERARKAFAVLAKGFGQAVTVEVAPMDWTLSPEGKLVPLAPGQGPYSAARWVEVALDPLALKPEEPVRLPFGVRVPPGPYAGSYWTAITFATKPAPAKSRRGVAVLNRLRIWGIVYVTVAGTERPGAEIANFDLDAEKGELILDVQNTGNVYLRLRATLTYKDESGRTIKAEKLPERVLLRDLLVRYRIPLVKAPEGAVAASVEVTAKGLASPLYAEVALK